MKTKIKKLYESRAFWMIISLVTSLAIWVYVSSEEGEEYKRTFRGVEVKLAGEALLRDSQNLVITDLNTGSVTIEVVGPRRVVAGINEDDLYVQVDVSRLSRAAFTSQQYAVIYPDGTETSNLRVTRRTPETVSFMVSTETSKVIEVRGSFEGSVADGYTAEAVEFDPATITVTGPKAYLDNVSYAWVSFGKENVDKTYEVETGYTLMSADNQPSLTTGIVSETEKIKATLPILTVKEITLGVNLVEGAGATSENTIVTIEPAAIKLAGDSRDLEGLNRINLATINLTEFSSSYGPVTFPIPIDDMFKNTTGVTEATVTVEVVGLETKSFVVTNIDYANLAEGLTASIETEKLEVKLRGSPESIAQIRDENIRAVADLSDIGDSTGEFMPKVRIHVDGFPDVGAISTKEKPLTVTINIGRTGA